MLSTSEIKKFIDDDISSAKKRKAAEGQRYYEAKHDILNCRFFYYNKDEKLVEDNYRANNKICHPFFTELSDQLTAHMLSFENNPIRAKEKVDGLQEHLDNYFDENFWAEVSELISGTYNKGFEYIYCYKNTENKLVFECSDSMGVVEVREKESSDNQKYIIYWYIDRIDKNNKIIKKIQVWSATDVSYFQQVNSGQIVPDSEMTPSTLPHVVFTDEESNERKGYSFGFIPFFRLDLNRKQISGLQPIKGLIDDYDIMQCGLSNNLADFDTPLHVVKGFEGDDLDKLQINLKTKKVVGVDEEGEIDVKTVNIPYQARQAKAADDEKNIYRFGMGMNTAGLKDTTATTNLIIKAAYALLDMKSDKLEIRLKKLLKKIIKIVLDEINAEYGTDYQLKDVEIKFERSTLTNDTENITNEKTKADTEQVRITTILNIAASVGEEQTLKAICAVMDWDFEEIQSQVEKMQKEADLQAVKNALNSTEPTEPIEEPIVTE
jgi:SPP1 family phage portal protein